MTARMRMYTRKLRDRTFSAACAINFTGMFGSPGGKDCVSLLLMLSGLYQPSRNVWFINRKLR